MKRYRFIIMLLVLICTMSISVSCTTAFKEQPAKEPSENSEAEKEVEEVQVYEPGAQYCAGKKKAEVYDADIDRRQLKVLGAAHSDGNYAAIYGECAVGALVTAKSSYGEFSVQSEGGTFAMRIKSPSQDTTVRLEVSQFYQNQQIGQSVAWEGQKSHGDYEEEWTVVIGKENQGLYKKMIPDFERTNLLSSSVLEQTESRYAERVKALSTVGDGCEMICVLVPSPMTVYPELVPTELATLGDGESKYDQIAKILTNAGAKVIDMRPIFEEHKDDELPLYYNYDSHWTEYGSYLAYVELFGYISGKYPDALPRKFDEFTWNWDYYTGGDMPYYFNVCKGGSVYEYTFRREMNFDVMSRVKNVSENRYVNANSVAYSSYSEAVKNGGNFNTNRDTLPDIFVYRNSYGAQMLDLLIERSNRAQVNPIFSYAYNFGQIKRTEPDYVIYIMSEWDLDNFVNN